MNQTCQEFSVSAYNRLFNHYSCGWSTKDIWIQATHVISSFEVLCPTFCMHLSFHPCMLCTPIPRLSTHLSFPLPSIHSYLLWQLFEALTLLCSTVPTCCHFHLTHITIKAVWARAKCNHQLFQRVQRHRTRPVQSKTGDMPLVWGQNWPSTQDYMSENTQSQCTTMGHMWWTWGPNWSICTARVSSKGTGNRTQGQRIFLKTCISASYF
jgi:hypothetical protein